MRVDTFSYELPPDRIAQQPSEDREAARLLVLLGAGARREVTVGDLASLLPVGALVVMNDTRVLRARLLAKKPETGGRVEIFLVRKVGERKVAIGEGDAAEEREVEVWRALGKASKPLKFDTDRKSVV